MVAGYAAKEFVKQGIEPGELCIVSADDTAPYKRPPLSKGFLAGDEDLDDILISSPDFYFSHGIKLQLNTWITHADFEAKALQRRSGEAITYDRLLIATGAWPRDLKVVEGQVEGIFYLRNVGHARDIHQYAHQAERAVVVGSGFIGMEVSSVLAEQDIETTLVFMDDQVMNGVFTAEMADYFQTYYQQRGVRLMPSSRVQSCDSTNSDISVALDVGEEIGTDMVVVGIGVYPEVSCLAKTELDTSDGVAANEYLETAIPDVYVAGDVARYHDVVSERVRRFEHEDNARHQGKHVARVMLGRREPFVHVPYFYSDMFDLSWEYWGDQAGADRVIYRGEPAGGSFSTWWLQGSRVVAAFVLNRPHEEGKIAEQWIKSRQQVDSSLLREEDRSLADAQV